MSFAEDTVRVLSTMVKSGDALWWMVSLFTAWVLWRSNPHGSRVTCRWLSQKVRPNWEYSRELEDDSEKMKRFRGSLGVCLSNYGLSKRVYPESALFSGI